MPKNKYNYLVQSFFTFFELYDGALDDLHNVDKDVVGTLQLLKHSINMVLHV